MRTGCVGWTRKIYYKHGLSGVVGVDHMITNHKLKAGCENYHVGLKFYQRARSAGSRRTFILGRRDTNMCGNECCDTKFLVRPRQNTKKSQDKFEWISLVFSNIVTPNIIPDIVTPNIVTPNNVTPNIVTPHIIPLKKIPWFKRGPSSPVFLKRKFRNPIYL